MKKEVLIALACLVCACGCSSDVEIEIPTSEVSQTLSIIQFTIDLEMEVLPFTATRTIPDMDVSEPTPVTKSDDTSDDLYTIIDYVVYQEDAPEVVYKQKQFTLEDDDFTIVYDSLPAGSYTICFLAHSNEDISISGQTATFDEVSDTFHKSLTFDLVGGQEVNQDVTLERIISKVEFVSTDAVTEDLKSFTIDVSNYQNSINLVSGDGASTDLEYTQTYTFQDSDIGEESFTHYFFTFVPASTTLSAHLTALDQLDEPTRERDVSDITPIRNKIIRYTGILYTPKTSDDTFTMEILNDGAWDETVDYDLTED